MAIRTNINASHLARMALISLFCVGLALWSLYDGMVGYPNQRIRAQAFLDFTEENQDLDPKDIVDKWKELAAERGWPIGNPGKPKSDYQITSQFFMAGLIGPVGLFLLIRLALSRGRWIEADETTLSSSQGEQLEFGQITELNKKKWQNKGIAKVKYESDGRMKQLVLDDCNYDRETTNAVLRHIEANLDHAKIVGGKPEPPVAQAKADSLGENG